MSNTPPISRDPVARFAEGQEWISQNFEISAQKTIQNSARVVAGVHADTMLSILHGEWLHEPLHAVLIDVPVGAWTVTVIADAAGGLMGWRSMEKAADVSLGIGLVGAVGAAVTGMVDWSEVKRETPRRIGSVHALLNVAATTLLIASWLTRKRDAKRTLARLLALGGYLVVGVSAHLGGNLVYEHGVGVQGLPTD